MTDRAAWLRVTWFVLCFAIPAFGTEDKTKAPRAAKQEHHGHGGHQGHETKRRKSETFLVWLNAGAFDPGQLSYENMIGKTDRICFVNNRKTEVELSFPPCLDAKTAKIKPTRSKCVIVKSLECGEVTVTGEPETAMSLVLK